jgi:hypothetical protein
MKYLKIPIEEIGEVSLRVDEEPPPVSCTCVAFAKTEAMGLLRKGWSKRKGSGGNRHWRAPHPVHRCLDVVEPFHQRFALIWGVTPVCLKMPTNLGEVFDLAGKDARIWVMPHGNITLPVVHSSE